MNAPREEKSVVPIRVTDHARERARERFPDFKAARIIDEVRSALKDGRFSSSVPAGWVGAARWEALYAWTPDGGRLYCIGTGDSDALVVVTCVKAEL